MSSKIALKKKDLGKFTIPYTIVIVKYAKALCDLCARINFMPFSMFCKLGLRTPKTTTMRILMDDSSIKKPIGVLYNVLVKIDQFIFLVDFVVLDCSIDHKVPTILGRPFLAIEREVDNVECGEIKFLVNNEEVTFNVCKPMKKPMDLLVILIIDVIDEKMINII
ncbi:uncharacterized protein LOC124891911 [Capsicum annuum]|uniref:uncharacterized protein LOC124891911 n=1 Tax=Capsicum annuum TaxID=4072 RepID=UPI001FB08109|nr:uncharacterized protein LOC124891911 [Capsicum annuum]